MSKKITVTLSDKATKYFHERMYSDTKEDGATACSQSECISHCLEELFDFENETDNQVWGWLHTYRQLNDDAKKHAADPSSAIERVSDEFSIDKMRELLSKPIDYSDVDNLAKDVWLFLTDDSMPDKKTISKEAFLNEVSAMLESVKVHFQSTPLTAKAVSDEENNLSLTDQFFAQDDSFQNSILNRQLVMIAFEWLRNIKGYKARDTAQGNWVDVKDDVVSRDEYEDAVNHIGQLQEQLKESEEYIRDLQKGYDH